MFCLDMAHMELGPLSQTSVSTIESYRATSPTAAEASQRSSHTPFRSDSASGAGVLPHNGSLYTVPVLTSASSISPATIGEYEATDGEDNTAHSSISYSNALDRVAATGDRSKHLSRISGEGEDSAALSGRFRKTLSLRKSDSGLIVGSYVLERMDDVPDKLLSPRPSFVQLLSARGSSDGGKKSRSVHNGAAFFREAASKRDSSMHVTPSACTSATVHGGTAHAAGLAGQQPGGIFYQGLS